MARNGSDDADYFGPQNSYQMLEGDRDSDPRFLGPPSKAARAARAEAISCP
jgi:hypothetical protein